jgi:hypothetical protein
MEGEAAGRISVVMPTYDCAPLMARHLESVAKWADLADEIIVVDSRSTDGTLDMIRKNLRHRNIRYIERDRGLYASWNEGIAATKGEWIYISTAGDTIDPEQLRHLRDLGERGRADVVISAPRFVDETGGACEDPGWPPAAVIAGSGRDEPFILGADAGFALAFMHFPSALLGSSASNLYRGDHLRARPFPTDFKGAGDSAWILRHAAQSRLCFTPQAGSTFCVHPKEGAPAGDELANLERKCLAEKQGSLGQTGLNQELCRLLSDHLRALIEVQAITRERRALWNARPRTISTLGSWAWLNMTYLRKRATLKDSLRRIRKEFLSRPSYEPVPPRTRPMALPGLCSDKGSR